MKKILLMAATGASVALLSGPALADSLDPSSYSTTLSVGGSATIDKVGTISAGGPTSAVADVLFVSDTTGSMGSAISAVRSTFGATATALSSFGDVATGAAQYKDQTAAGDPFNYNLDAPISKNSSSTQAAINTWSAYGGGDDPEQGLYALTQASGSSTGWRTGAKKIIVQTGDAPSHDAITSPPAAGGATVANTAAALKAAGITVESLNASNITGDTGLNNYGQFSGPGSIYAAGVKGSYTSTFPSTSSLTATLEALIGSAFNTYSDVSLVALGLPASGITVSLPADITGTFDRSVDRTFDFDPLTITGTAPGTYKFEIALEADGGILAEEGDTVTVTSGPTPVPEPTTLALMGIGLVGLRASRRRRSAH
jgi:hypothetical protein